MLSDARIAEIAAVEQAATPGPWISDEAYGDEGGRLDVIRTERYEHIIEGYIPDADKEFIADARQAVPELLAEVQRLRAQVAASYTAEDIRAAQTLRALVRHSVQLGDRREWTTPEQDARMDADIHAARVYLTTLLGADRADALLKLL